MRPVDDDTEPDAPAPEAEAAAAEGAAAGERRDPLADVEITRWDVLCVGPILVDSLYRLVGQPLTPALTGTHPVLAAFVRGSAPSIIICGALAHGGNVPLWQALLAPYLILTWVDPFYYWAGRRYGRAILDYYAGQSDRMNRRVRRAEAWFAKYGVWAILLGAFIPVAPLLFVAAGESRMNFAVFLAADSVSNLMGISLWVLLGWFLGNERGQTVADAISHYAIYLTIASIVLVVVLVYRQTRANMRAMAERGARDDS